MWHLKMIFIFLSLSTLSFAEVKEGKALFDKGSCLECHNHKDFGDKKTKIKKFKQLEERVQACQLVGDDELFDDEVHDIAKYLNKDFYKLKK